MDSDSDKGGVDIGSNRQRKFGLPSWMVNNMERLNYVTDFEQYGCSPPETEGFLTDYVEGSRYPDNIATDDRTGFQDSRVTLTCENNRSEDVVRGSLDRNRRPYPTLANLRQVDDTLVSSPDSTPCATPEPSPVIRRKVSIPHPGDTVLTNPGRWFYFGKLKKSSASSVATDHPASSIGSENRDCVDGPKTGQSVKLVITNFDLNAVSPNSW